MGQYKELINKNINLINKIVIFIYSKAYSNEFDDEIVQHINMLTDQFLRLTELIYNFESNNDEIVITINNLSDEIVNLIQYFNKNDLTNINDILSNKFKESFEYLFSMIEKNLKYRVVIYGVNDISIKVQHLIDYDKCELVCYISNNSEHWYKYIDGIQILPLDRVNECPYDYLIISDEDIEQINKKLEANTVSYEQIFNYKYYNSKFGFYMSPEFYIQLNKFMKDDKEYDGIITGISYIQKGINTKFLNEKFYNFAAPSQDIFYDFEIAKYALSFPELKRSIKYAIIGLCYYSFQYDLSKSTHENRANYYYLVTQKYHNYNRAKENIDFLNNFSNISNKILLENHNQLFIDWQEPKYQQVLNDAKKKEFNSTVLTSDEKYKHINSVKKEFDKNYPETVEENKLLFAKYLDLLYSLKIRPIIVIPPFTNIYRDNIKKSLRDEFYNIIYEFRAKYEFQVLDYFYSEDFEDNDFYDIGHLNDKGAERFTRILNKQIIRI